MLDVPTNRLHIAPGRAGPGRHHASHPGRIARRRTSSSNRTRTHLPEDHRAKGIRVTTAPGEHNPVPEPTDAHRVSLVAGKPSY